MKKIDVLIMIENKNRELETALLLKKILNSRGYTCEIGQQGWSISKVRLTCATKVVVTPWCYDQRDLDLMKAFYSCRDDNTLSIVNLHCEQLVFREAIDYFTPKGDSLQVFHTSWGPYYTKILHDAGAEDEMIAETGSTRLDFFRKEFFTIDKELLGSQFGLDPNKHWVFFVGNFSGAFSTQKSIKTLEQRGVGGGEKRKQVSVDAYSTMLKWLEQFLQDKQLAENAEVIYRPHPSEQITKEILEIEKHYSNLKVIKELAIRDWYQTADVAFVWSSTSSVEAVFAGTPVFSLNLCHQSKISSIEMINNLQTLNSVDEVKQIVGKMLNGEHVETCKDFIDDLKNYYHVDDKLATELTANLVERALESKAGRFKSAVPIGWSISMFFKYYIKLVLLKVGILNRIPHFKTWIDNRVTEDDFSHANAVAECYSSKEK